MNRYILQICVITFACMFQSETTFANTCKHGNQMEEKAVHSEFFTRKESESTDNHNGAKAVGEKVHQIAEKTKEVAHNVIDTVEHKVHDLNVKSAQKMQEGAEQKAQALKHKATEAKEYAKAAKQHTLEISSYQNDPVAQEAHENHLKAALKAQEIAEAKVQQLKEQLVEAKEQVKLARLHAVQVAVTNDSVAQKAHENHVWAAQKAQTRAEQRALRFKEKTADAEHQAKIAEQHTQAVSKQG